MSISKDDFDQWAANAVTKAVIERLREVQSLAVQEILGLPVGDSLESYGLKIATISSFIDGLAQTSDIDALRYDLVGGDNE